MALRRIQGKSSGPIASNVPIQAMPNYIAEDGRNEHRWPKQQTASLAHVPEGAGFGTPHRRNRSAQLSTERCQESLGNQLSISAIIMAPIDAKVSIGTFVQLIRRLTSGPIKRSRQI